jgi:hypothetical protein
MVLMVGVNKGVKRSVEIVEHFALCLYVHEKGQGKMKERKIDVNFLHYQL